MLFISLASSDKVFPLPFVHIPGRHDTDFSRALGPDDDEQIPERIAFVNLKRTFDEARRRGRRSLAL